MVTAAPSFAVSARLIFGTASQFEANEITRMESATIGTNKFVVCYADASAGQCRVGTVSGTTITWGTESQFAADVVIAESLIGVCQLDTDKFAVVYGDDGQAEDGFVRAASVSGTTITWGAAVEFSNNLDADSVGCVDIATDKIIVGYNDEGTSGTGSGVACTASGTAMTCGTINDYAVTDYYALYNTPAKLGTDKFVMSFCSQDGTSAHVVAGTTSGTTITWGTVVTITTDTTSNTYACSPQDADRFVVVYNDETGSAGRAVAGTTSGTTITLGSVIDFNPTSEDVGSPACDFISANRFIVSYPDVGGAASYGVAKVCEVDWTTRAVTCGEQVTYAAVDTLDSILTNGQALQVIDGYGTSDVKFVVGYVDTPGLDDGYAIIGRALRRRVIISDP